MSKSDVFEGMKLNDSVTKTINSLTEIKNHVIGVMKLYDNPEGIYELITREYKGDILTYDTISISTLGAVHRTYNVPESFGEVHMFSNGENLNNILDEPNKLKELFETI